MKRLLVILLLVIAVAGCIDTGGTSDINTEEEAEEANDEVLDDISTLQDDLKDIDNIINE